MVFEKAVRVDWNSMTLAELDSLMLGLKWEKIDLPSEVWLDGDSKCVRLEAGELE